MTDARRSLLVVEDDPALQTQMKWAFDAYEVAVASDLDGAIAQVRRMEPAVITLDLGLPPEPGTAVEGFRALEKILELSPETKVIVVTGQHDSANARRAVALGAYDFFAKPFDPSIVSLIIDRAFRMHDLQVENKRLLETRSENAGGMLTGSPEMLEVCRMVERVGATNAGVVLLGESGTGKELLARALHEASTRKDKRFVAINCAAIPDTLLESELFGYERGAFTGANKQTPGRIETANQGTLFLDEIGDLPMALQAKLLRFLQERVIERLGGREGIPVDVRIISATHQNLRDRIASGQFREDLFYRLAEIVVTVPALRDRSGDAAMLAHAFVRRFADEQKRGKLSLGDDAVIAIERHRWPGNVRELENVIKRAVILSDGPVIRAKDLGLEAATSDEQPLNLREAREAAERREVVRALARVNGNLSKAADLLGVSRPTLYDLLNRFGLRKQE
ncbi:MAG TPA: PEP-CTERM-box response regulator transcription factor [Rhizobiaceae bacterium]|nr:PEP-CTERM-box response regulator transcription factor [Rhizobiaceae bacterium]